MPDRRRLVNVFVTGIYEMSVDEQAASLPQLLGDVMSVADEKAALDLGLPGWNDGLIETRLVRFEGGCDQ